MDIEQDILDYDTEGTKTEQKCPECENFLYERYIGTSPDDYDSEFYCKECNYMEKI